MPYVNYIEQSPGGPPPEKRVVVGGAPPTQARRQAQPTPPQAKEQEQTGRKMSTSASRSSVDEIAQSAQLAVEFGRQMMPAKNAT